MSDSGATKILVVEDDDKTATALSVRLKAEGYDVVMASDGVQAVSSAVKHVPDLVLLDISMPAGNGLTVAERLLKLESTMHIPIVIMTASKSPEIQDAAIQLGAKCFLEKPFDSELLLEVVERFTGNDQDL